MTGLRRKFCASIVVGCLAGGASGQTFTAINDLQVVPLGAGEFEVIEARGEGPRGIWCAAADYVLARDGSGNGKRLYVSRPRASALSSASRKGVGFTTQGGKVPQRASTVSVSVNIAGQNLPVNHALQFCRDPDRDSDDFIIPAPGD